GTAETYGRQRGARLWRGGSTPGRTEPGIAGKHVRHLPAALAFMAKCRRRIARNSPHSRRYARFVWMAARAATGRWRRASAAAYASVQFDFRYEARMA